MCKKQDQNYIWSKNTSQVCKSSLSQDCCKTVTRLLQDCFKTVISWFPYLPNSSMFPNPAEFRRIPPNVPKIPPIAPKSQISLKNSVFDRIMPFWAVLFRFGQIKDKCLLITRTTTTTTTKSLRRPLLLRTRGKKRR